MRQSSYAKGVGREHMHLIIFYNSANLWNSTSFNFRYKNAVVYMSLNIFISYEELFKPVPFSASDTAYISCNVIVRQVFSKMDINFEITYYTIYLFVASHPM